MRAAEPAAGDRVTEPDGHAAVEQGVGHSGAAVQDFDKALAIAARPDVIFTSYGDMLRVPGSANDLLSLKARGADVRVVYSPVEAVTLARQHPDRQVVFFAVGFETTAPANAPPARRARRCVS